MSITEMKQALETLEENHHLIEEHEHPDYLARYNRRISALRTAIEQAEKSNIKQVIHLYDKPPAAPVQKEN